MEIILYLFDAFKSNSFGKLQEDKKRIQLAAIIIKNSKFLETILKLIKEITSLLAIFSNSKEEILKNRVQPLK